MRLLRSIHAAELTSAIAPHGGCVLTIGNFDGVHLGHRQILQTLVAHGKRLNLPAVVMTFDPHPQEYFRADSAHARLTTTGTRFFALRECGVDIMLSLKFDRALAHTSAADFIRGHLAERLRVKYLLIGDDFRFGAKRAGDFAMLAQMAGECGYAVERFDTVKRHDHRVSSTWIRELLGSGDLARATQLLGRKYAHAGRVMYGDQRGREWGYPTINLAIRHRPAITGVFAVWVTGLAAVPLAGVASLGTRPTVGGAPESSAVRNLLEVYLFDYDGDAYGRRVCVEFVEKIRAEEKYNDYAALIAQIAQDAAAAKTILQVATQ